MLDGIPVLKTGNLLSANYITTLTFIFIKEQW